ncbi:hypothetical protein AB0M47_41950 [Hamadaea sp. NPDC051192]|uniref:hypothetical protein n=1 Tax=Hamadaea sp. NPDC051192 TaxID=3154940 RepID=UPI00341BD079
MRGLSDAETAHPIRGPIRTYLSRIWQRRRLLFVLTITLIVSIVLLRAAFLGVSAGMADILVNLGASLLGVVVTVMVLEPLIERSRTPEEVIHSEFPHQAFLEGVATANRVVRVMGAWPYVMDHPWRRRFLGELRQAVERGVRVQILILDPESKAAEQRTRDLDNQFDVAVVIGDVLQTFWDLTRQLPDRSVGQLAVRVYSSLPPARMYRWDSRAVSSFFPKGNWVGSDIKHYETSMNSRLAQFVDEQFDLLWRDAETVPLGEYFLVDLDIATPAADFLTRRAQYAVVDGELFIAAADIVTELYRMRVVDPQVRVDWDTLPIEPPDGPVSLLPVDADRLPTLRTHFHRKYGTASAIAGADSVLRIGVSPTDR